MAGLQKIHVSEPIKEQDGRFTASVVFKHAAWSLFRGKKFSGLTPESALARANEFAALLSSASDWAQVEREAKDFSGEPMRRKPSANINSLFSYAYSAWTGALSGDAVLRVKYDPAPTLAESRQRVIDFKKAWQESLQASLAI